MPVSFVVNRSTVLRTDNDGDNVADAGDVLRHTLTFTNTGDTDALNVVVNDLLGGSTETGLMNISPIAFNDAFTAVGNTALRVGGAGNIGSGPSSQVAGNLLSNDVGSTIIGVGPLAADDVTGFTLDTVTNGTTTLGGTFNVFADGSFNYISQAGDSGVDTFTYTIRDAGINGIAGDADDTTSSATVSITITGQVWYVDSGAAGGGDGTSANPFNSITALNTANVDGANDYIYVKGNATGQLVLEQGEHLIGQGADLDVAGFHLADDGTRSTVTNSTAGFGVTLAGGGTGNNEIAGINIVSTGGAGNHGLTGTSFGNLTLNNTTIDASGQALVLSTGAIVAGSTGLVSTDSDGGTNNVSLTSITGTLALGTGALSGATGTAFNVSGGSVTATYAGNVSQASASQALVNVTGGHSGTLTFSTGTLSATNGTGLQFDNADGSYNFNGTNTLNGGDAGVDIVNGSGGAFSFSTNSSITNPTGIAFNVNGGNGNIDYNGTITHTNNAQTIAVQNHTGGTVSFDGTVSSTGNADGINLAGNAGATINLTNTLTINTSASNTTGFSATGGGTVNVSHSGNTINSGGGTGVNINNTNVNFTGGTLDIDTTSGVGFTASGGGTITVTGSNNSITSVSATALNVSGTTIGAAGLTFRDISSGNNTAAADPVNGIVLANTGSTAGLSVTGDGGGANNGSGGTIQRTTGDGISLTNTMDVHLGYMNLTSNLGDGIGGSGVNGFVLNRMNITLNGDDAAADESGINLAELTGTAAAGLHPTSISNSVFTNNEEFQVQITNTTGTLTAFQFTNNTVTADGSSGTIGNLVNFLGLGTANMAITTTGGTYTGGAPLTATGLNIDHSGTSGTMTATVNGGTFTNNNVAVTMSVAQGGNIDFDVTGVTATGNRSHGLNLFVAASSTGTVTGSFVNNIVGTAGVSASGSDAGFGIRVQNEGSVATPNPVTVLISGNTVREILNFSAININQGIAGQALSRTTNATIINNTISDVDNGRAIVFQQNNSTNATSAGIANLDIHGNILSLATIAGQVGDGTVIRVRQLDANGGDVNIVQSQATAAAIATELDDANGFNNSAKVSISGSVDYSQPGPPLPLIFVGNNGELYVWELDPRNFGTPTSTPDDVPQGGGSGGDAPAPAGDPGPVVVDDGVLSQAELALIVDAAIARWAAAGASAEELAAMQAVTFTVEDLAGRFLGASTAGQVSLDSDAAGARWFIDTTPGDDNEFVDNGAGLRGASGASAYHVDLLTVVMHELGHQIGLGDSYAAGDDGQLMDGTISSGERRLPGADEVAQATGTATAGALALTPVSIGTVQAGRTITVQWDSTVDSFADMMVPSFNNHSTISGTNFVSVNSNTEVLGPTSAPLALDSVTLGNLVFFDANANGTFDGADVGINSVALTLFADTNANGVFDSGTDVQIATTTTAGGGLYSFANLAPGNYIVRVDAANFLAGGALVGRLTTTGGSDPDNNTDLDDNGADAAGGIVVSQAITLTQNGETTNDLTGHLDINNTLDFGFIQLNQPPVNTVPGTQTINEDATLTFTGGTAISVNDPDVGAGDLTVTISVLNGQLTLSGTAGLTFAMGGGDGTDDTSMTFSGTQAAVNAALAGLLYETTLDYNGSDTLTIVTNDNGNTGSDPGTSGGPADEEDTDTVTINITAVADVVTDTPTVGEDSGANNLDLLGNDSFENPGRAITAVGAALHGTTSINDNGTAGDATDDFVVYTPDADYNGADTFTYTVTSGGVTEVGTVNVTVSAVADIADDSPSTAEDTAVDVDVLANDTFEGTPAITNVGAALHGTAVLNDNGTLGDTTDDYIVYTPNADYNGADSFTYQVTSGGVTETATVNVTVTAVADIVDDSVGVIQDTVDNALDLLANDTFENAGRAITAVGAALHGTTAIDDNGTAGDATDDFVTYTPTGGYIGPDSFTYTVTSGGVMETATVTVNVAAANIAPVVDLNTGAGGIDDTNLYVENGAPSGIGVAIDVTDADVGDNIESATITITDPEAGDLLSVTLPLPPGITVDTVNSTDTTLILIGSATPAAYASALGQVGYENTGNDPTDGGTNTNRLITVVVNDGTSDSAAATMTMNIATDDDPGVAQDDEFTTDEATGVSGSLFADNSHGPDTDPDGAIAIATVNNAAFTFGVQFSLPSGALLTVNADGTFDYDPNGFFDPTPDAASGAVNQPDSDSFTYELVGGSQATVTITIDGIDTDDTLLGTAGPDTLDGGTGVDTMSGLAGDDTYYVDNAGDVVNEAVGEGNDRVATSVSYTLAAGSEVERLDARDLTDTTALSLTGNEFANTIIGNNGDNILDGGAGNDTLGGQDGHDILIGGTGDDLMNGNDGNDTYYVDSAADSVSEAVGEGNDRIAASSSFILDATAEVETLEAVNLGDTTAINLIGNDFVNTIIGNNGANVLGGGGGDDLLIGLGGADALVGGTGADTMFGGTGDDTYYVDDSGDIVNEAAGEGFDRIAATASFALDGTAEIEVLEATNLSSTNAMDLTGNDFDNTITGNDGVNILRGNGGADILSAAGGDDFLIGGAGNDTMGGGAGNDTYYVDDVGDIVYEAVGEGFDRIATSVSVTLGSEQEVELVEAVNYSDTTAINLTGNEFDNALVGNAGANVLNGGDGDDDLVGLGGADIFQFTTVLGPDNVDQIGDFVSGTDRIQLENAIFDQLVAGALPGGLFHVGTAATNEDQRIIYDSATGNLYYDSDGTGALAQVLFASLQGHPTLLASDFTVI